MARFFSVVSTVIVLGFSLFAQSYDPVLETGIAPFQSYGGGSVDSVNLATGNLSLHIPLVSFPQRGGVLHANFLLSHNSTTIHKYCPYITACFWRTAGDAYVVANNNQVGIVPDIGNPVNLPDGTTHIMGMTDTTGGSYPTTHLRSVDGSGLHETQIASQAGLSDTIVDRNGVTYYCPPNSSTTSNPCTLTDANGNQLTFNMCCGPLGFTDTMGRQIPNPPSPPGNWIVPGPNGASATYQISTSGITLPDLTAYSFQYTTFTLPLLTGQTTPQTFNVLSKVTFPSGGSISYGYPTSLIASPCNNGQNFHAPVISRTVDANDGMGSHKWMYDYTSSTVTTVTDPLGNQSTHTFALGTCYPYESQDKQMDSQGNVLKTINIQYSSIGDQNASYVGPLDVLPMSITTVWPNGQQSTVSKTYDKDHGSTFRFGLTANQVGILWANQQSGYTDSPWTVSETDYTGAVLRTTNTNYKAFSSSTYFGENLLDLVSSVQVTDGGGTQKAYTTYGYDESALQASGITQQKVAGEPYPGNQTSIHRWLSNGSAVSQSPCNVSVPNGGYLVTNNVYFDTGEIQKSTDPCLYSTTYQYSSTYDGAYPTTVTNPLSQDTSYGYDFNTGAVTSITDPNLQLTTKSYDIMGRPTQVSYPDGGSTSYCYTDLGGPTCTQSGPPYEVVKTTAITSSQNEKSTFVFDGLSRALQTQLNSDPTGADYVDITYDADGRKSTVSNPHRSQSSTTDGVTSYVYDALGRICVVGQPDGAATSQSSGCPTTAPAGDEFTQYAGNCTTVTDETGHSRKSCVDGLGRVTGVWEDQTGLSYSTFYTYDALGSLTCVEQHGSASGTGCSSPPSSDAASPWRVRRFTYDSLSRLTSATNPESGTTTYTYDADGNVVAKTAPAPNQSSTATVTTTYSYDKLNRLIQKTVSDGLTPAAQFGYDGAALSGCATSPPGDTDSYPIGHRTSMCDGSGATNWTHDKMGRIKQERRTIGAVKGDYETDIYNLDGSVASLTTLGYGIAYTYNGAGRQTSAKNGADPFNYVTSATYAPFGGLSTASLGSRPITLTNTYNNRLQPLLISAAAASSIMSLCYDFHSATAISSAPCSFAANTSGDNGNVFQIQNNRNSNRTQNFVYDSLNRIQQAYTSGANWGETFTIDAWGNLTNRAGVTGKTLSEPLNTTATLQNHLSGFGYDAAGNMTTNGTATYTYDAENRLISTAGQSYIYDGDGKRVEKCTAGSTAGTCATGATGTLYWTGTGSDPLVETDLAGNILETYIFFNDNRIARRDASDEGGALLLLRPPQHALDHHGCQRHHAASGRIGLLPVRRRNHNHE
jgi:YD repeat-containing protein